MKDKIIKFSFAIIFVSILTISILYPMKQKLEKDNLLASAASRERTTIINNDIVIIDNDIVALIGNPELVDERCDLILNAINIERSKNNLPPVTKIGELAAAAYIRAKEQEQLFSHTRPDGTDWWTVDSRVCYGEILAKDYTTSDAVIAAWMASPTHKSVIIDENYKTCGVGVYVSPNGTTFIAAEFGY